MRHKEVKEPARGELLRAFSQTPPEFEKGITDTLARLQGEKEGSPVKRKMGYVPVLAAALALLLVVAAAAAALYPGTVERFREAFGEGYLRGEETAELNESCTLGDVSYTVTDAVWEDGVLYGTVVMRPREGANIVLIPEDYKVSDPAGYAIYEGEEAPEDAKSYAELAAERGAKIVLAKCVPDGYVIQGELLTGDIGYFFTPTQEGEILTSFEVHGWNGNINHASSYTLRLNPHNWEVTLDGQWLREEPDSTWLKTEWDVQVVPLLEDGTQPEQKEPSPPEETGDRMDAEIIVPDGFDGWLPVYALGTKEYYDRIRLEWFDSSELVQKQKGEGSDTYVFADGGCLTVEAEGILRFETLEGTETITYSDGSTFEAPRKKMASYIANLAFDVYFDADSVPVQNSAQNMPEEKTLTEITLEDARHAVEALLSHLGIKDAQMTWAYAMDTARIREWGNARNAAIAEGRLLNCNPRDLKDVGVENEGYALVYQTYVGDVPVDEAYMRIYAFVDAQGLRDLTLYAPFERGEAEGNVQKLISPQQAWSLAVEAAAKGWIEEMEDVMRKAYRVELLYKPREKAWLVPVWRVWGMDGEWPVSVDVSAEDGRILQAPWM